MIYVGCGKEEVEMYRGNYKISDYVEERKPLKISSIVATQEGYEIDFEKKIIADIKINDDLFLIDLKKIDNNINRFWIRIRADKEEKCYGCGEQMSYFNLRGRNFPLWTSEPGVGRDKSTYIT